MELVGDIHGANRQIEASRHGLRGENDARNFAMRSINGQVQIRLFLLGGHSRGRPRALDVNHDDGDFGHSSEAQELNHERKPGTARRRHGLHRRRTTPR